MSLTKQDLVNAIAAASGTNLCAIDQTYIIDGTVTLPKGMTLVSPAGLGTIQAQSDMTMLQVNGTGVSIKGIKFIAPSNNSTAIGNSAQADGLVIDGCTANCPILNTQGSINGFQVSNCTLNGQDKSQGNPAIVLAYVSGGKVFGNKIQNYSHGIQLWGNDSAPSNGGAVLTTDPHLCHDIDIHDNHVTNVAGGGIFCSMAANVQVHNNDVSLCGDVGIDLEGAVNWLVEYNTVTDCANGNLTTFFNNDKNVFHMNRSVLTGKAGNKHFACYNGNNPVVANNISVTFNSNVFDGNGSIGQDYVANVYSDGKNALLNGAYQAWTGGSTPFKDNSTQDIPQAGCQASAVTTPPVTVPPVTTPPVTQPTNTDAVAQAKLAVDEAKQKADEAILASLQAQQKLDEAKEAAAEARISTLEARLNKLKTI